MVVVSNTVRACVRATRSFLYWAHNAESSNGAVLHFKDPRCLLMYRSAARWYVARLSCVYATAPHSDDDAMPLPVALARQLAS